MINKRVELAEREGVVKRLHVDQQRIRSNQKDGGDRPVLIVQTSAGPLRAGGEVNISGSSRLVYSGGKPLSCGARVWVETTAALSCDDWSLPIK